MKDPTIVEHSKLEYYIALHFVLQHVCVKSQSCVIIMREICTLCSNMYCMHSESIGNHTGSGKEKNAVNIQQPDNCKHTYTHVYTRIHTHTHSVD